MRSLFLFHRDLRLDDNTALIRACKESDEVLLAFIFPPEQIDPVRNPYFSHAAVQFMCESLAAIQAPVRFFKGDNIAVLARIRKEFRFDALYQNEDYSVYARKRDADIRRWCDGNGIKYITEEDYGLFPLRTGLVSDDPPRPYTVLAQFYRRYLKGGPALEVRRPVSLSAPRFVPSTRAPRGDLVRDGLKDFYRENTGLAEKGGRAEGLRIMRGVKKFNGYAKTRDFPALTDGTTRISAHLKFGTISIRELYWACVSAFKTRDHPLIRELIFREFYMKIYAMQPELQRGRAFHHDLDKGVPWSYDKKKMDAWKSGKTGFPLADAGMRQLSTIGWCHNRVRMLVASVATKYLLLDWRHCAQYFYTQLVDADTYSNTAGWGWASSTGVDPVLYFRAPFNPFIQSKKFDTDAIYIKSWIPELRNVATKDIHKWWDPEVRAKYPDVDYPAPIVDYKDASAHAVAVFKKAVNKSSNGKSAKR